MRLFLFSVWVAALLVWSPAEGQDAAVLFRKIAQVGVRATSLARWRTALEGKAPDDLLQKIKVMENKHLAAKQPGEQEENDCDTCKNIIGPIMDFIDFLDWPMVYDILVEVCDEAVVEIDPNFQKDIFCPGLMRLQGRALYDVFKRAADESITTVTICQRMNLCFDQAKSANDNIRHKRSPKSRFPAGQIEKLRAQIARNVMPIGIPSALAGKRETELPTEKTTTFTVVQLADIHISPDYTEGSSTDCGLYVCCYSYYSGSGSAGRYGDYNCNIPERTFKLFLDKIKGLTTQPDFILYSGDHPPHQMHNETYEFQMDSTRNLISLLTREMSGRKIYPAIANHEMFPTNQFSMQERQDTRPMVHEFANLWAPFADFGDAQNSSMRAGGYYTVLAKTGLRILAFNTNYGYALNFYNILNYDHSEYENQKKFMEDTLRDAQSNGEKVIMLGHHPPGIDDAIYLWGRFYTNLIRQYKNIIVLQLFGHTHNDHFNVITSADGTTAEGVALISPSITSSHNVNPSMRIFTFDSSSFALQDYEQWYMDLNQTRLTKTTPEIVKSYSAKEEYGLPDMSPGSFFNLAKRIETDDALFAKFNRHFSAGTSGDCDDTCRVERVCGLQTSSSDKYKECYDEKIKLIPTTTSGEDVTTAGTPPSGTRTPPATTPSPPIGPTTPCAPCVCQTRPPAASGAPSVVPLSGMLMTALTFMFTVMFN